MTIIEIEDSLGEDLGLGLQDTLTDVPEVKFAPLAIGDTGLADLAYCNWPRALAYDLAECHPAIVIVFLGGNDCQPVSNGDTNATPVALGGTKVFDVAYSARVSALMSEATAAGARVFWVGLPIIAPDTGGEAGDTYSDCMKELNADYHLEASSHSGVTYFSTWRVFEDSPGPLRPVPRTRRQARRGPKSRRPSHQRARRHRPDRERRGRRHRSDVPHQALKDPRSNLPHLSAFGDRCRQPGARISN